MLPKEEHKMPRTLKNWKEISNSNALKKLRMIMKIKKKILKMRWNNGQVRDKTHQWMTTKKNGRKLMLKLKESRLIQQNSNKSLQKLGVTTILRRRPRKAEILKKPRMKHLPYLKIDQAKEKRNSTNSMESSKRPRETSMEIWQISKNIKRTFNQTNLMKILKRIWKRLKR